MKNSYIKGEKYTRKDIFVNLGLNKNMRGGVWFTGYAKDIDDWYIFANIGVPGKTGDDYDNKFENNLFRWYGKNNSHIEQPSIQSLINKNTRVFIFTRTNNKDPKFTFWGEAYAQDVIEEKPVKVFWKQK